MVVVLEAIAVAWGSMTVVSVYKTVKDLNEVKPMLKEAEKQLEAVEKLLARHRNAAPSNVYYVPPEANIQKVLAVLERGHEQLDGELWAYYRQLDEDTDKKNASWLPWHPCITITRGHEGHELVDKIESLHWQVKATSKTIREGNDARFPRQDKLLLLKALPTPNPNFDIRPPSRLLKVFLFPLGGCATPSSKQKEKWKSLTPWPLPNQGDESSNNECDDDQTKNGLTKLTGNASAHDSPVKSQARSILPILTSSPLAPHVTTQPASAIVPIHGSASALTSLQKETPESEAIELQNQSKSTTTLPAVSPQTPVPSTSSQPPLSSTTSQTPLPSSESPTSP